jgi:hypothetical protein
VSEETGLLSFVQKGEIRRGLDPPKLRAAIFEALGVGPKEPKEKEPKVSEANSETEEIASI